MPNQDAADITMHSDVSSENGGNGNAVEEKDVRIAFTDDIPKPSEEVMERYESILETYAKKVERKIQENVGKALTANSVGQELATELAEPINVVGYKWWDIFVVGPIQNITLPPFLPHKIIADDERAFFVVFIVKNQLPTPGGGPSALTLMNGRRFQLQANFCNLTTCSPGPRIHFRRRFDLRTVQPYLLVFNPPRARQGRPDLYEINVTVDTVEYRQPMAAFATRFLDIDNDPGGLRFPLDSRKGPHIHDEQPLRFLVYKP